MKHISFFATWPQILAQTKDVTRRLGWKKLKPGDRLQAIQKGQGLKRGEKVVKGPVIEIVSNEPEPLSDIAARPCRGETPHSEGWREGFPAMTAEQFITMFCELNDCTPETVVRRIEFKYLKP